MVSNHLKLRHIVAVAVVGAVLLSTPRPAEAVVVERIVAVIGERAILLSDLRKRARPALVKLHSRALPPPQHAAAESQIYSQFIQMMVNEELEAVAAARNNTRITTVEVDKALRQIARTRNTTLTEMYELIERETGMTELEYRQEIRRQVLEGKLLNRFIQNQRVTEDELEAMFEQIKKQERLVLMYHPSWIVLRLAKTPDKAQVASRMKQAKEIVARARAGADFGSLARQYSEDDDLHEGTRSKGGDLGPRLHSRAPGARSSKYDSLDPVLENVAFRLEVGQVSEPLRFEDAIVVMTVTSRQPSRFESVSKARVQLTHMVRVQKLEKIKHKWLGDLRRRTHVDVRL